MMSAHYSKIWYSSILESSAKVRVKVRIMFRDTVLYHTSRLTEQQT